MRLPRMPTRRWMVAVAAVALGMGGTVAGIRLKQRRDRFLSRAQLHEGIAVAFMKLEGIARETSSEFPRDITELERQEREGDDVEPLLRNMKVDLDRSKETLTTLPGKRAYHAAMARKYRRAARYPWLPVEPDPPAPK
jgi:hypothetical protein